MPIRESDLPGVGKKYEIDLEWSDDRLVIITHNTGKREVFLKDDPDADSEKLFELSDQLARTVGTILEGAHFQPIASEDTSTTLGDGTIIEWFDVADGAEIVGTTLADILADDSIGVAVTAVQRGDEVVPASEAETTIQASDTVVAVGSKAAIARFESLVGAEPNPTDED